MIKFIVKSWGSNPDQALENAKKYFPDKEVKNILVRQITEETLPDWEVEAEYE